MSVQKNQNRTGSKYVLSLIQIDGEEHVRFPWPEGADELLIGRSEDCEITINSPKVSREHCSISRLSDDMFLVVDLNSTNGTWYEDGRISETELPLDSKIQIGNYLLKINSVQWSGTGEQEMNNDESVF